jgi:ribosome biogenesis GTPase
VAAETIGIRGLIAVNKAELLDEDDGAVLERSRGYEAIGYPVIHTSVKREHGIDRLIAHLRNETSILVGQSGVGKSSLVKALLPDQEIQIGRLSAATGLGRHTTSAATLYFLPHGGTLIDSPGVRSFRLQTMSRHELEQGFRELRPYAGECQFGNCAHDREPGCAVRNAAERDEIPKWRLDSFRHMALQLEKQTS